MSYIKVFTNILIDTETYINIQKSIYWKNPKTVCVIKKKIRKMVSWTQVLEDIYCSGKKGRKQRRAELGIVKDLPGFRRESTEERKPEDHFRKNTTLRFSWEFMTDQPGCISARCPTWIVHSALKGRTVALVKRDLKWKKLGFRQSESRGTCWNSSCPQRWCRQLANSSLSHSCSKTGRGCPVKILQVVHVKLKFQLTIECSRL